MRYVIAALLAIVAIGAAGVWALGEFGDGLTSTQVAVSEPIIREPETPVTIAATPNVLETAKADPAPAPPKPAATKPAPAKPAAVPAPAAPVEAAPAPEAATLPAAAPTPTDPAIDAPAAAPEPSAAAKPVDPLKAAAAAAKARMAEAARAATGSPGAALKPSLDSSGPAKAATSAPAATPAPAPAPEPIISAASAPPAAAEPAPAPVQTAKTKAAAPATKLAQAQAADSIPAVVPAAATGLAAQFKSRKVTYNRPPKTLALNKAIDVSLVINATEDVDAGAKALEGFPGTVVERDVELSDIVSAQLTGVGFDIATQTVERQKLSGKTINRWQWRVTPTEVGQRTIILEIFGYESGSLDAEPLDAYRDDIVVEVKQLDQVIGWAKSVQPVFAVLAAMAGAASALFAFLRFREERKRGSTPPSA